MTCTALVMLFKFATAAAAAAAEHIEQFPSTMHLSHAHFVPAEQVLIRFVTLTRRES